MSQKRLRMLMLESLGLSLATVFTLLLFHIGYVVWYTLGFLILLTGACIIKQEYHHRHNLLKGMALIISVFIVSLPAVLGGPYIIIYLLDALPPAEGSFAFLNAFSTIMVLLAVPYLMVAFGAVIFVVTTEDALQKIFRVLDLLRSGFLVLFRKERLE